MKLMEMAIDRVDQRLAYQDEGNKKMRRAIITGFSVLAAVLMSGCSGGGGGSSFDSRFNSVERIYETVDAMDRTVPSTLPGTGNTTYTGHYYANYTDDPDDRYTDLLGNMELTATFASDVVSGTVTDLVSLDNVEYTGQLDMEMAPINRAADIATQWTFGGVVSGELDGDDGSTISIFGDYQGDFADDGSAVIGETDGSISGSVNTGFVGGFAGLD